MTDETPAKIGQPLRRWYWLLLFVGAAVLIFFSQPSLPDNRSIKSEAGTIKIETVAKGLKHPWGLAFLPDGEMLVTEKTGALRRVTKDGKVSEPLKGVPEVTDDGQGGLLDVAIDPDFASNSLVYLSYSEPGKGGSTTAAARGKLGDGGLEDVKVIFRQEPRINNGLHFGSRFAFAPDGTLFITLGERFQFAPAQDLSNTLGKIIRINPDGSIPKDNPFVGREGARPEIWSYGHRNAQGAAIHPDTGKLWETEFGPRGGDELNIPKAGTNYGWPVVSWGDHYNGKDIPKPPTRPEFADAIYHWNPVISPSGIAFYTAEAIPAWKGNLLIAGLSSEGIVRLTLDGEKVSAEERLPTGVRIRDVAQGPDGAVYALTDENNGKILRLTLENSPK
jgi:glucose/arabinose dehydrogenase